MTTETTTASSRRIFLGRLGAAAACGGFASVTNDAPGLLAQGARACRGGVSSVQVA